MIMNKTEFINTLANTLKERKINDVDEIVAEYEQHFIFKMADGYSEEEIAARLGDPKALGKQFNSETNKTTTGSKVIVAIGLVFTDIIVTMLFVLLFTWAIVLGAVVVAFTVAGVCLISNLNISSLLPSMPYFVGLIFAAMSLALAVLAAVGTEYCWLYARQLLRSYRRWHANTLAAAGGEATLPQIPAHPQIGAVKNRRMRKIALIALTVFVITFQSGYIIAMLTAGAFQFWHVWGWFVK
jgi:uncharacterized membrane protein